MESIEDILQLNLSQPGLMDGQLNVSDKEINILMDDYAKRSFGTNTALDKFHKFERERRGEKSWDQKNVLEKKHEYLSYLKNDLEFISKEIPKNKKLEFCLSRANSENDPASLFYKVALVRLGAKLDQEGKVLVNEEVMRNFNQLLVNKDITELVPFKKLDRQFEIEDQNLKNSPRLKLSL